MASPRLYPLSSLSPQLLDVLKEATDQRLRNVLMAILTSRYASASPDLEDFRLAIRDKDVKDVLSDFRKLVPLTDYEAYRPWIAKLMKRPCKLSEVEDLLAPGLPRFIGTSSSTSGSTPKFFARYPGSTGLSRPVPGQEGSADLKGTTAFLYTLCYRDRFDITADTGDVVRSLPVCLISSGFMRTNEGWPVETDSTRMASIAPGYAAPWATGLISHHRSFLLIHALFTLANPNVDRIFMSFITFFVDMMCFIEEEWDTLLAGIRHGVIPEFDNIDHVRDYLQIHMRADPQRADELKSIGPPSSIPGWAPHIWPRFNTLICICSGTFATALPKARSIIGPDVITTSLGYGCTECVVGIPLNLDDPSTFVVDTTNVVEYLCTADDQGHENIYQAWDLQPGNLYQPVVTTQDGLWRYVIEDVLHVIGFDPRDGSPVFKFHGRKNLMIRTVYAVVSEAELLKMIYAINEEGMVWVQEFTTVLDRRELPETVGCIVEITGEIGSNANSARQKALEALVSMNDEHQRAFNAGRLRLPTIRIVKHGTFAEYRRWRGTRLNAGVGQIKVPVAMVDPDSIGWLEDRVVKEL